jgi:predicted lipid-binding transport protein (Tim44 family)
MNTPSASNPFTGLKGALAGLMSGGWMGLLLGLLFRRRIAPMLAALESLFAQWKAGTLPMPPAAPLRPTARTPTAARQAATPSAPRARCRVPTARRMQVAQRAAAGIRPTVPPPSVAPQRPMPSLRAPHPSRRHARCTKNANGEAQSRTP